MKSSRSLSGQNPITVFDLRSTVMGGASVGKLTDNGNGTTVQEFSAPANGGELKYYTTIALNLAAFDWTAPEGIKKSDVELDARGADVETTNPYDNGGDGGASYPEHPDATNYMRCLDGSAPVSCSLQDKFDENDRRHNYQKTCLVFADGSKQCFSDPAEANKRGSLATASMHESIHAQVVGQTNKPADSPSNGGMMTPASVPGTSGQSQSGGSNAGSNDTIYGPANGESFVPVNVGTNADDGDPDVDLENKVVTVRGGGPSELVDASVGMIGGVKNGIKRLPLCVQNAIKKYYESVGNSSAERMERVSNSAAGLSYSTNGFPIASPPTLGKFLGRKIRAYTQSNHINFNYDEYDPTSAYGMALIIHEFTHIMQFVEYKDFSMRYVKEWVRHGDGEENIYEHRAYVNGRNSEAFFNKNPELLCK